MTMTRETLSEILAPGHYEVMLNDVEQWPEEYSLLFNVESSSKRQETTKSVTGFSTVPVKDEGDNMTFDDALQGYPEEFVHLTYVLGYRVSEELYEDDLYRVIDRMPKQLTRSFMVTTEILGAGLLNNGFTDSAAYRGPDSEPLFGDSMLKTHPRPDGGTWQNQLSTAADLSMDTLELLVELLEDTVDDRGLQAMLRGKTLVVPLQEQFNATELLDTEAMREKPQTANRGINPMKNKDLTFAVNHWLTDPDAVFLRATEIKTLWFWRIKFGGERSIRFWDDEGPGVMNARGRMRASHGWEDARGWVGSPGV
jgi:hypothetical protein